MFGGIGMEFKFNCLKPLLFLIVCICLCITSSYAFAGDADNITLSNVADIGIADEDNIIGSDFNQIDDREIILGNSTDGFIDDNTFDVVYSQILYSYSTGVNADPVECGGFVFFENCLIKISQVDMANADESIGYYKITGNNVKILNSTFTNSQVLKTDCSNVEYLCGNVMSPICFANNGSGSDCLFSGNAMDGGVMGCSANDGVCDVSVSHNISTSGIACGSHFNCLNYTICNNSAVNASNGLSRGSGYYNRSGKNVNIALSFGRDLNNFNSFAVKKNYSRNNIDNISEDIGSIVSQFIVDNYVNAGTHNVFVLTINGTLNEFEIAFAKDDLGDFYTFLFDEDSLDTLSLVKNSYDCRKQCEIFGINPVYSLKYDGSIASTHCFYTNFLNTIFSDFYLTACSDFPQTFILNTDFKDSYADLNNAYDFSKFFFGAGESEVSLNYSSLNYGGMNYCIEKMSLAVIDGGIAMNSNILYYCVVENGIFKHVCIGDAVIGGFNCGLNALEVKWGILMIMLEGEVM